MKAIRVNEHGGPEVLSCEEVDTPRMSEEEVLVKVESAGINFIDTYQRSGLYQIPLHRPWVLRPPGQWSRPEQTLPD